MAASKELARTVAHGCGRTQTFQDERAVTASAFVRQRARSLVNNSSTRVGRCARAQTDADHLRTALLFRRILAEIRYSKWDAQCAASDFVSQREIRREIWRGILATTHAVFVRSACAQNTVFVRSASRCGDTSLVRNTREQI